MSQTNNFRWLCLSGNVLAGQYVIDTMLDQGGFRNKRSGRKVGSIAVACPKVVS